MDTAVGLVKAYLELCGYFVLAELPVRAADRTGYHDVTDIDVIAVSFPHKAHALAGKLARPLDVLLGADPDLGSFKDGLDVIVGEVKESQARLNPALRRREIVAFALRRVGCCPEENVEEEAQRVIDYGQREFKMPEAEGMRCRVRLVVFAGYNASDDQPVRYVPLGHCAAFIERRLHESRDVLSGAQFKDQTLGFFALQEKLSGFKQKRDSLRPR